ncbi:YkgJ family cysteine cluster protein [Veronia pacifica]|uniref:YkgJ family cysteine cluster protein n=1 Tax=Veronia pacifica TaxID=1080227 RepID=UPI0009F466F2|nr:YkgJ family cysteine cluster protein [Veronia pacifica]
MNRINLITSTECRLGCGACCIAPSISSPIPGMPSGKPAGVRCVQLNEKNLCRLFGKPERPKVCSQFKPDATICGTSNVYAMATLTELEELT